MEKTTPGLEVLLEEQGTSEGVLGEGRCLRLGTAMRRRWGHSMGIQNARLGSRVCPSGHGRG